MAAETEDQTYIVNEQQFALLVPGLKPETRHYFYFDGADRSSDCAPQYGKIGDSLFSDENGELALTFFYKSSIVQTTDVKEQLSENDRLAGVKKVVISSSDNSSRAETTLTVAPQDTSNSILTKTTETDITLSS